MVTLGGRGCDQVRAEMGLANLENRSLIINPPMDYNLLIDELFGKVIPPSLVKLSTRFRPS